MYAWLIRCLRVQKHNHPWCWRCEICDVIKHMCFQLHINHTQTDNQWNMFANWPYVTCKLRDCKISFHIIDACIITWFMLASAHYFSWHHHFYVWAKGAVYLKKPHQSPGVAVSMEFSSRPTAATCRCSIGRAAGWRITHAADIGKANTVGQY